MNAPCNVRVRAFGGLAPLGGRKLVRLAFMDEAGTSRREPFVVVASVLVHGDEQLIPVEEHLEALVEKHIPEADRDGFVFHATNIWSGTKYFDNDEKWPLQKRLAILRDLVAIPAKFELPIAFGFVDKNDLRLEEPDSKTLSPKDLDRGVHGIAFSTCSLVIEKTMREVWPDEVALIIAEDRQLVREAIKEFHAICRDPRAVKRYDLDGTYFPLTRIRDTVHWAKKKESRHLQLADVCSFFIRGYLCGSPHVRPFYEALRPWLLVLPKRDAIETAYPFGPVRMA